MNRATRKALRTLLQLIASGGLTVLVSAVAEGLSPTSAGLVLALNTVAVTFLQNLLEAEGVVPTLLPTTMPVNERNPQQVSTCRS